MNNQVTNAPVPLGRMTAGTIVDGMRGGLDYALEVWNKVEQVKNTRASNGSELSARDSNPELENGAAVQVDTTAADIKAQREAGITQPGEINKGLLYFSIGALVLGLAFKAKGFK